MAIHISEESLAAAVATIRDGHQVFESAVTLPDLSLTNAPLAGSATELFTTEWNNSVTAYHDLLDAVETALGVVGRSLIDLDRRMAEAPRVGGGPR